MSEQARDLLDKLNTAHSLTLTEYETLLSEWNTEGIASYAAHLADTARRRIYGTDIYIRGLIEIGNVCRNDCYYCGIRKSNTHCDRYILTEDEILMCAEEGHRLGFRTFVLQGGEGVIPTDTICSITARIKQAFPDTAVTLSLGEFPRDDYARMFAKGADRYLLRHETADKEHYKSLHPAGMSFENRMRCLKDLKDIGFQTGCGFMVGSPGQSIHTLAEDLKFIETFSPEMCGIGPFIPHKDTTFSGHSAGSADLTCFLLSLIRLIKPNILLPATTALGTIDPKGREKGILSGANVIMPNLSPTSVRKKYELYDNKLSSGDEAAECIEHLKEHINAIGYRIVTDRGDIKEGK